MPRQIRTSSDRFPINLLLEYENNLDAKDHPQAPTGNGVVLTDLGKQSHTYLADISLGPTKNKNDFQDGYAWLREEQDAAIASFAESHQRARPPTFCRIAGTRYGNCGPTPWPAIPSDTGAS